MSTYCARVLSLMLAIENDKVEEALRILSEEPESSAFLEPVGTLQVTAVQLAAWRGRKSLLRSLYEKGADVNASDKLGRCALYYAAQQGNADIVEWLLQRGAIADSKVEINSWPKDLPYFTTLTKTPNCRIGNNLPLPECWGRTPLHQAVKNNHSDVVRILIKAGAEVDARDERRVTPLLLAGANVDLSDPNEVSKFEEIVDLLVSANAMTNVVHPDTGTTALHHAASLGSSVATKSLLEGGAWPLFQCTSTGITPLHLAAGNGNLKTVLVLLEFIDPMLINIQDNVGRTPLHRAAYQNHHECVRVLVDHGGNLAAETKTGMTVIDAIFGHVTRPLIFLTDILDSQIHSNNSSVMDRGINVSVDFGVLAPKGELQMRVVSALIEALSDIEQLTILQHPLVEVFLGLKWSRLRFFFFLLVLAHFIFVISLSSYAIILLRGSSDFDLSRRALLFCSCIIMSHKLMQILMEPRYYLKQFETWLSLTCAIISFVISAAGNFVHGITFQSVEKGLKDSKQHPPPWILHSISVAILLAWIQIMLLIGRFPTWGYYALMFSTVLKNVLKVLLAFICLIIGFALSFSVLFHGNDQFHNFWRTVIKTIVMMMGEYEYEDLFASETRNETFLPVTSRIAFVAFVMLASIVLMNLMTGLAVNDIQGLQRKGHICRLMKQAEFIALLERVLSHRIFRRKWLNCRLKILLDAICNITTKVTLNGCESYLYRSNNISAEQAEALFVLASKNRFPDKIVQVTNSDYEIDDENLSTALNNLKRQFQELRRQVYPNLHAQRFTRTLMKHRSSRRRKSTIT